MFVERCSAA
ncbi:hypothetical protein Tsp_11785, partial [Trichinella spiralis]